MPLLTKCSKDDPIITSNADIYNLKKYVVKIDNGKGFWYAHEPDGGCHNPEPCNK